MKKILIKKKKKTNLRGEKGVAELPPHPKNEPKTKMV
jgi:hypothetical protein